MADLAIVSQILLSVLAVKNYIYNQLIFLPKITIFVIKRISVLFITMTFTLNQADKNDSSHKNIDVLIFTNRN